MNKKTIRILAAIMSLLLLVVSAIPTMAEAASDVIFNFDTEKPNGSSGGKGVDITFDTQNGNSSTCMKLTPQVGYGLSEIQYVFVGNAGTFTSDGVVLWAKSERYSATMGFIFEMSWYDDTNTKRTSTYTTKFIVTNNGREIVIPFDSLTRSSGTECVVKDVASKAFVRIYIRYSARPDDGVLSPIWLDTLRQKNANDVVTPPVYGEPDAALPVDPDTLYTPSTETPANTVLQNFSAIPSGTSASGFTMVQNTNPAKADAGTSLKLTPKLGYSLSEMSLAIGVAKGKATGSGISFWMKAEQEVTVDVILQLSSAEDASIKADYAMQLVIGTQGKKYDVPFSSLKQRNGTALNPSTAARGQFFRIIIKFYGQPVTTLYFDTLQNMAYDESLEATDPVVVETTSTTRPAEQEELLSHEYNWDLNSPWELDWMDDFSGTELNLDNWTFDYGIRNTAEIGYFTNREKNVRVENGELVIETLKEDYDEGNGVIANYTSAEVVTRDHKNFLYGRLEIRAKLPGGKGMWPAFWTVGQGVAWPKGGEIDILEMIGGQWNNHEGGRGTDLAHFTLHWAKDGTGGHQADGQSFVLPNGKDFTTDYHIIGMIWTPKEVKFYIDEDILHSIQITSSERYDGFHLPHYAMINTSVGANEGTWASTPDDTTWLTRQLYKVDYIKYYTYAGDGYNPTPGTGGSTTTTQPAGEVTTTQAVATTTQAPTTTKPTTVVTTTAVPTTTAAPTVAPSITEQTGLTVSGDTEDRVVTGFTQGATVDSISATSNDVTVEFYDKNGAKVQNGVKIATGMTMKIVKDSNVTDYAQVVIYGDVTGDGNTNASDLLTLKNHLLSTNTLEGCYYEAAKVSKGSSVSAVDMLTIKRVLLNVETITQ
ncbi:MAG: family 16 glycosylhydrolase [Clostridia bacterium]|nr:family 16 glycosylhydrolase [Clostridia bacterium]